MATQISTQKKELMQKYTNDFFKNKTLEFYGIKTAKIKELVNVKFSVEKEPTDSIDYVFLLEDATYLHIEFQSSYSRDALLNFANYNLRLFEQGELENLSEKTVTTIVIYSADVNEAQKNLDSASFNPYIIMMKNFDGNYILNYLETKINQAKELQDVDMLNLILVPLMKNNLSKEDIAIKSIKLANTINDKEKQATCIASILILAQKYLDKKNINKLLEEVKETDFAKFFLDK